MPVFKKYDPVPAFKFVVSVGGVEVGYFTECEGLRFERDVVEFKEGGTNDFVYMFPGPPKRGRVTLKRGSDPDLKLLEWFNIGAANGQVKRANVSILIYNSAGERISRFDLPEAWPVKYDGPRLEVDSIQPSVDSIEIAYGGTGETAPQVQRKFEAQTLDEHGLSGSPAAGAIDLQRLAERVLTLMKREARLERERFGPT